MGMSASQARLLSITSRLTNNEFRSQTITNSKLRLAEKSQEASSIYMDALSSQQLMYCTYNDNGDYVKEALTPAIIYDYQPLKNQYAMVNPAGKMLVSAKDAENFENSDNLQEFLEKYGLLEDVSYNTKTEIKNENYEKDKEEYDDNLIKYNNYQQYLKDLEQYEKDYEAWKLRNPNYAQELALYEGWMRTMGDKNMYDEFSGIVGTSDTAISDNSGTKFCYSEALNGNTGCYKHILNLLIKFNGTNCETVNGETTTNKSVIVNAGGGGTLSNMTDNTQKATMGMVSSAMPYCKCDADDDLGIYGKQNLLKQQIDAGTLPENIDEADLLKSDYKIVKNEDGTVKKDKDGNVEFELKTLYEKAIDLYYLIDKGMVTDATEMRELLINFTDGDMKNVSVQRPEDPPIRPTEVPFVAIPEVPSQYITVYENGGEAVVKDKEKAQWYTNLWYMMNGSETANLVKSAEILDYYTDADGDKVGQIKQTLNVFIVDVADKTTTGGTYEIFEDNLYKSSDWLQFALEHGMITLHQAQYFNPSENSGKVSELTSEGITWNAIIHSSATDIVSQDDEVKIALAEAKYKNTIREIENKDKKFDQDLKKLDTEHSALQTEYDSIKEVISKNVDRSFKAFS